MSDIERARKARLSAARRAARRQWEDQLSIEVRVSWPHGIVGWLCGMMLLLAPPVLVMAMARFELWQRRRGPDRSNKPRGAA